MNANWMPNTHRVAQRNAHRTGMHHEGQTKTYRTELAPQDHTAKKFPNNGTRNGID